MNRDANNEKETFCSHASNGVFVSIVKGVDRRTEAMLHCSNHCQNHQKCYQRSE